MDDLRSDALQLALRLQRQGATKFALMPAQEGSVDLFRNGVALAEALGELSGAPCALVDFTGRHAGVCRLIESRAHCEVIGGAGGVTALRTELPALQAKYRNIVVDISGFKTRGEHLEAVALLDGVIQLVQLGVTTEAAVLRHQLEFPPSANLGIVTVAC